MIVKFKNLPLNRVNLYISGASILDAHQAFVYGTDDKIVIYLKNITGLVKSDLNLYRNLIIIKDRIHNSGIPLFLELLSQAQSVV